MQSQSRMKERGRNTLHTINPMWYIDDQMTKRFNEILHPGKKPQLRRGKNLYGLLQVASRINLGSPGNARNAESMTDVDGKEVKFSE